jgi:hypothetical protein
MLTPKECVVAGLCDISKLFPKEEPHSQKKLEEGRVRLIVSMSIVDNIIARLLFALQNNTEINNWQSIPSKPGIGFSDENLKIMFQSTVRKTNKAMADVSGWDWSMQEFDFEADLKRRAFLNDGFRSVWFLIASAHYYVVQRKLFMLADGSLYAQILPGIMPSGWYNTSSTNSFTRCLNSYWVQLQSGLRPYELWAEAMGDDSLERFVQEAPYYYSLLGKNLKFYESFDQTFEFCSLLFKDGIGAPVSPDKMLVNLLQHSKREVEFRVQVFNQFSYETRNLDLSLRSELFALIQKSGFWSGVSADVICDPASSHLDGW